DKGGSYRTIQRFFHTKIDWAKIQWLFFHNFLFRPGTVHLLAGDESVMSKSAKQTYGIGWFFSSILNTAIPGLALFSLAFLDGACFVLEGDFGNAFGDSMVRQVGLHIISKMQHNAQLYQQPTAEEKAQRPRLKYGARIDYAHLPDTLRVSSLTQEGYCNEVY